MRIDQAVKDRSSCVRCSISVEVVQAVKDRPAVEVVQAVKDRPAVEVVQAVKAVEDKSPLKLLYLC